MLLYLMFVDVVVSCKLGPCVRLNMCVCVCVCVCVCRTICMPIPTEGPGMPTTDQRMVPGLKSRDRRGERVLL